MVQPLPKMPFSWKHEIENPLFRVAVAFSHVTHAYGETFAIQYYDTKMQRGTATIKQIVHAQCIIIHRTHTFSALI